MDIFLIDKRASNSITEQEFNETNFRFQEFCGTLFYALYDRFLRAQAQEHGAMRETCVILMGSSGCEVQLHPTSKQVQQHQLRAVQESMSLDPFPSTFSISAAFDQVRALGEENSGMKRMFVLCGELFGSSEDQAGVHALVRDDGFSAHVVYLQTYVPFQWSTVGQLQVSCMHDSSDFESFLATQSQPYLYSSNPPVTVRQFLEQHGTRQFKAERVEFLDFFVSPHTSAPVTKQAQQCGCHHSVVSHTGRTRSVYCGVTGKRLGVDDTYTGLQVGRFTVSSLGRDVLEHRWYYGQPQSGTSEKLPAQLGLSTSGLHFGYVVGAVPLNTVLYPFLDHISRILPLSSLPQSTVEEFPQKYTEEEYTRQDAQWRGVQHAQRQRAIGLQIESFVEDVSTAPAPSSQYNSRKRWLQIATHGQQQQYGVTPGVDLQKQPRVTDCGVSQQDEETLKQMHQSGELVQEFIDQQPVHTGESLVDYMDGFTDELSVTQQSSHSSAIHCGSTTSINSAATSTAKRKETVADTMDENLDNENTYVPPAVIPSYKLPSNIPSAQYKPSTIPPPLTVAAKASSQYKRVKK